MVNKNTCYANIFRQMNDRNTNLCIIGCTDCCTGESCYNELLSLLRTVTYKHKGKKITFDIVSDTTFSFGDDSSFRLRIPYDKGVVIYDITKEEAIQLAKDTNQNSIVWKDENAIYLMTVDSPDDYFDFSKLTGIYKTLPGNPYFY